MLEGDPQLCQMAHPLRVAEEKGRGLREQNAKPVTSMRNIEGDSHDRHGTQSFFTKRPNNHVAGPAGPREKVLR